MFDLDRLSSIKIGLASPEAIRNWSYAERHGAKPGAGEVTKAETINYRSQKPEPDGLFCERIFGPAKDYECHCGKYKKIRFAGITCEKCGVEVTTKAVRRERMGYINLASPCAHIWYLKGTPSKMALLLDIAPKDLEEVVYFQSHIVLSAGSCKLLEYKEVLDEKDGREKFIQILNSFLDEGVVTDSQPEEKKRCLELIDHLHNNQETYDFISTSRFITKFTGAQFGWGAEAAKQLLKEVDVNAEFDNIEKELKETQGQKNQKRIKLLKRLEVVEALRNSDNDPSWMILDSIPVIPPDLRPMTQLDGGRYAVSDLNELYRRVIIRNARLKKLIDMKSPTVIMVNEKRMLQEAIDALIDNGRRNKPVTGTQGRPLKSLSSALKGKAGRFRQNLLGKRVDYSGRSVICVGPFLRMDQCGLPREMAIQLFKPFIACELMKERYASTTKQADQMIARYDDRVYDVLEKIVPNHPVLLNRAPTLHRLGIEAFRPVLVDGRAIRLHPLVCPGFNADFDGDQMAIHVPLSREAQQEAFDLMISTKNILSPRDATVLSIPVQDIVVGHYFLTSEQAPADFIAQQKEAEERGDAVEAERFAGYAVADGHVFRDFDEVMRAYDAHVVHMNNRIAIPAAALHKSSFTSEQQHSFLITTVGKLIFNNMFPEDFPYINDAPSHAKGSFVKAFDSWFVPMGTDIKAYLKDHWNQLQPVSKKELATIINELFRRYHATRTALLLDRIKDTGYYYCTKLGLTISITDIDPLPGREKVIADADKDVEQIQENFDEGLLTPDQRHSAIIKRWTAAKDTVTSMVGDYMRANPRNPVFMMARSGARGSINNFVQLIGIRGLMSGPNGKILEIPVKDSFRDGMDVSEYFIATHGARKGSTDTALKTADSGYLTRRLVDVSHAVVIKEEDCGADRGFWVRHVVDSDGKEVVSVSQRCLGRFAAHDILDKDGKLIIAGNNFIDEAAAAKIAAAGLETVEIRSLLTCLSEDGVCIHCYGRNMATGEMAKIGDTVGIMAAQSIGEPGTQLTMRTFHEGGTAGSDITQGLPRVQELLEVRNPKGQATISSIEGKVTKIEQVGESRWAITVTNEMEEKEYTTNYGSKVKAVLGEHVLNGQPLTYGSIDPKELLNDTDVATVARYLIDEVQKVYCSQGINISDKHIEVIVRQMLSKIVVVDGGDTDLVSGIRTDLLTFTEKNQKALEHGQRPAVGRPLILGVTKAALDTYSFLSAASFQEVTRVLTDATLQGKTDYLKGLKENVMIGKLIPAGTGIAPLDPDEDFVAKEQESKDDFEALESGFTDSEFFPERLLGYGYVQEPSSTIGAESAKPDDAEEGDTGDTAAGKTVPDTAGVEAK